MDPEGHQIQLEYNEGDIVKRQKERGEEPGMATISLRVPLEVRDRFRYAVVLAKHLQGIAEKGMYPAKVVEYMIEEFVQGHEHEVEPSKLAELKKRAAGEKVPGVDAEQIGIPGIDSEPDPEADASRD